MENPIKMDDLGVPLFLETSVGKKSGTPPRKEIHHTFPESIQASSATFSKVDRPASTMIPTFPRNDSILFEP